MWRWFSVPKVEINDIQMGPDYLTKPSYVYKLLKKKSEFKQFSYNKHGRKRMQHYYYSC